LGELTLLRGLNPFANHLEKN